ncbi:hypothetical protein GC163_24450 [bacterium]|nr:hypothetical protein [bacterium]
MNSKEDRDQAWMASLDRQFTPAEALEFESRLSPAEQERLSREYRLEELIMERLLDGSECPEALSRRILLQVRNGSSRWTRAKKALPWFAVAAAAVIVVSALPWMPTGFGFREADSTAALPPMAASVAELARESQTPADRAAVERFLQDHGVQLALADFNQLLPDSGHDVTLLGVRKGVSNDGSLLEILFNCCGFPVKLYVAPRDTDGALRIEQAHASGGLQERAIVADYLAAVAGSHPADNLLRVLQPVSEILG